MSSNKTSKTGKTGKTSIGDIPDSLLGAVLQQVSQRTGKFNTHVLVCQHWAQAFPDSADNVRIRAGAELITPGVAELLQGASAIRELHLSKASVSSLSDDLLRSIAATCPRLQSLTFDQDCCNQQSASALYTATQAGLDALFTGCPELRHVSLRAQGALVPPESLGLLTNLQSLEVLSLKGVHEPVRSTRTTVEYIGRQRRETTRDHLNYDTLVDVDVASLCQTVSCLRNMTKLKFSSCTPSLPHSLSALWRLKDLSLECPRITEVPAALDRLTRLQKLHLMASIWLPSLPDSFCRLQKLRDVHLCAFELPESFGELSSLTTLELDSPRLAALPNSFGDLPRLRVLKLKCSSLAQLPLTFGNLSQLADLNISGSDRLDSLPEGFGRLPSLATLTIHDCPWLRNLSSDFGQLSALKTLHLSWLPHIWKLPDCLFQLSCLESLDIGYLGFSFPKLPERIGDLWATGEGPHIPAPNPGPERVARAGTQGSRGGRRPGQWCKGYRLLGTR